MFDDEMNPAERRAQHSGLAWIAVLAIVAIGAAILGCGALVWVAVR